MTTLSWLDCALRALDTHPVSGPRVGLVLLRRALEEAAARALASRAPGVEQSPLAARFLAWEAVARDRSAVRTLYEAWSRCSAMMHLGGDVLPVGADALRRQIADVRALLRVALEVDPTG